MPAALVAQNTTSAWSTLRDFNDADGRGAVRTARLVEASNGLIYGVRQAGGTSDRGTLFSLSPDGTGFTVLHNFNSEGDAPACLVAAQDGKLYGVTDGWRDTVFQINADGSGYSILHDFTNSATGWKPGDLIEGTDGVLYGACLVGGPTNYDAAVGIFCIGRDSTGFRLLRILDRTTEGAGVNGYSGVTLVQGSDGALYGSAPGVGRNDCGTLFRMNTDGAGFTILRQMTAADGRQPNRLVFAGDGKIYGTAFFGGSSDLGTIFRMDRDGANFTVIRNLRGSFQTPTESQHPRAGLVVGNDGLLYGVSSNGGSLGDIGTLYRVDPATGGYLLLRVMQSSDGAPVADLLAASNGRFYGMTSGGGLHRYGTLFAYTPANATNLLKAAVGLPFTYAASSLLGVARTYLAEGLPAGLSIDSLTGTISGTPREAGAFSVKLSAPVPSNVGPLTVRLEVGPGAAHVTIGALSQLYDGGPKPVSVVTQPAGLPVTVTYAGSPTPPIAPGTYTVAAQVADNNYTGAAAATLTISGTAPLIEPLASVPPAIAGSHLTLQANIIGAEPIIYRWQRQPFGEAGFIDLTDGAVFTGASTPNLSIAALTSAMDGDEFRLVATNALGTTTSATVRLTVFPAAVLANVAIRARIATGVPLTVGFVTRGERSLLVRAVGPGLAAFIEGAEAAVDPVLVVRDSRNVTLAENDNWSGSRILANAFSAAGAFPLSDASQDAALIASITGAATAQMAVARSGIGLIEVYDPGASPGLRIINFSALHEAGADHEALVVGFSISGTGTKRLLVRGIGPALRAFGITSSLSDPRLEVYSPRGARLVENDDWPESLTSEFIKVGAFGLPDGSKDAALILNVPVGSYTAQLSSAGGARGVGLIEIYELP